MYIRNDRWVGYAPHMMLATVVDETPPAMTPDAVGAKMFVVGASSDPVSVQSPRQAPPPMKQPPLPPVHGAKAAGNATPPNPLGSAPQTDSVRMPTIKGIGQDAEWLKRMRSILAFLTKEGFDPMFVTDPFDDPEEHAKYKSLVDEKLTGSMIFSLDGESAETVSPVDTREAFFKQPSIVWHILAVTMLMHGNTTKTDFLKRLFQEWTDVLDYVKSLTRNKTASALRILHEIIPEHAKETTQTYTTLLLCDDSTRLSKARAEIIIAWTQRLKSDARECWNRNRINARVLSLTDHLMTLKPKGKADVKSKKDEDSEF